MAQLHVPAWRVVSLVAYITWCQTDIPLTLNTAFAQILGIFVCVFKVRDTLEFEYTTRKMPDFQRDLLF